MIRHYFLAILFITAGFVSSAQYTQQSKYFVYLQTEPAQPFYIKINGQQLSANASGYLILPQLKEGDYKLVVGFPQEKHPQQTYNFAIDSKDKGYLIKDFGTEGWGLFDLQTMAVQKPLTANQAMAVNNTPVPQPEATTPKENVSDFTKVLSKAANDPGLLEKPKPEPVVEEKKEIVIEQPKPQPVEKKKEEVVSSAPQEVVTETIEKPKKNTEPQIAESVSKNTNSHNNNQSGVMVQYDNKNEAGQPEPVTIFIKEPKVLPQVQKQTATEAPVATPEVKEQPAVKENQEPSTFQVEEKPAMPQEQAPEETQKVVNTNNNCKKFADEDDFLKLRRQMSQKDTDDGMITQAKTAFKSRCYTTAQIKYLSSMFLSNAGKYNFYEAALPHIADTENFASLGSEINDQFYKEKFNTLIGR